MASSLSRKLLQTMLTNPNSRSIIIKPWRLPFCSKVDLSETEPEPEPEPESTTTVFSSSAPSWEDNKGEAPKVFEQRPLENGLEVGIYKAILVGQVGQTPIQKRLKSGRTVTLLSIGTGGIRNNRRPFDNEEPREYANRCAVQWHRVSVYPDRLAEMAMKSIVPGSILYVEGNLETKIFTDPITGLVRRIREVAVRRNGRLVSLGNGSEAPRPSQAEVRGVGYY